MDSIFHRISVRKFEDRPVEKELVDKILRAGMAAPSAINQQPWEFYVVTNRDILKKLSEMGANVKLLEKAPAAIVFAMRDDVPLPEFAPIDMSICVENIWLETDALGLGGVMMGLYPHEDRGEIAAKLVGMRDGVKAFCMFAFGYPAEFRDQQDRYDEARIHFVE